MSLVSHFKGIQDYWTGTVDYPSDTTFRRVLLHVRWESLTQAFFVSLVARTSPSNSRSVDLDAIA
jgi:hypothetical protein